MTITENQKQPINHTTFLELVNANVIRRVSTINDGKWSLLIQVGSAERILHTKRGAVRKFSNLNTVENYLRSVGVQRFEVELV